MNERSVILMHQIVYVVAGDGDRDSAVFLREQDAEAFARTYDDDIGCWPMVERCTIADAETADEMVRQNREAMIDTEGVHWSLEEGAPIEAADDSDRFSSDLEAALHIGRQGYPFLMYEEGTGPDGQR